MSKFCIGDIFTTNRDGAIAILDIDEFGICTVKFLNTGFVRKTRKSQILKGTVKDKSLSSSRNAKLKFEAVLENGEILLLTKVTELLHVISDQNVNKLYNHMYGKSKHPEIVSITRLKEIY